MAPQKISAADRPAAVRQSGQEDAAQQRKTGGTAFLAARSTVRIDAGEGKAQ